VSAWRAVALRPIHFALIAAAASGCGAKQLSYSPVLRFSIDEARSIVGRTLEEQHRKFRPTSVEVTDEKIAVIFHRTRTKRVFLINVGVVSIPEPDTLYFDDLARTDLFYKKVSIWFACGTAVIESA
jgi:hypothetical protein